MKLNNKNFNNVKELSPKVQVTLHSKIAMLDLQRLYPYNLNLIKNVEDLDTVVFLTRKVFVLIIFQLLLKSKKCVSHFCRETPISFWVVNRALPSLHGGSLEVKLTNPVPWSYKSSALKFVSSVSRDLFNAWRKTFCFFSFKISI